MARIVCAFAWAAAALAGPAAAQESLQTVTVTGRNDAAPSVTGFDNVPLSRAPFSATVIGPSTLADVGASNLADITHAAAGVSDAYNAAGYWSLFTVRGFVLDPRSNYRRDGLPINAETALWLGNKQNIEVLRGTSGTQAGTSAPGGLINLEVKRPSGFRRVATLGWAERGSALVAMDLGDRAGPDGSIAWRINAEHEELDPLLRASNGRRQGVAAAADWRVGTNTLLEAEVELNRQSQRSQAGFSLLGNRVPDANDIDPRINLNNQPWALPVVFTGRTASLRWTQRLTSDLMFSAHAMTQHLRTDDRIAFPFGCSAEGNFDRYCSDGTFDLYDYRSEGERRRSDALDVALAGRASWLGQEHRWRGGVLLSRQQANLPRQAFNLVGTGTIDGNTVTAPDPSLTGEGSDRDEHNTEAYLRDQWSLTERTTLWLGVRHSRLARQSVATNGDNPIDVTQTFTTPWVAASWQLGEHTTVYASTGQGVESTVTPNLPTYNTPGQPLPALKSRQVEAGIKHDSGPISASAIAFEIRRPLFSDVPDGLLLTRVVDGRQRHRGIELDASWRGGPWSLQGNATALRATREGALNPAGNALKPANVPERSARAQVNYQWATLPGLVLSAGVQHDGSRFVLPDDNSVSIPAWTRLDLAARLEQRVADGTTLTWRLGVDNATDKRAWREAPFQFNHAYLYPLAPRTWRASLQAAF
jgi:iron complex outermembrane receptor protein